MRRDRGYSRCGWPLNPSVPRIQDGAESNRLSAPDRQAFRHGLAAGSIHDSGLEKITLRVDRQFFSVQVVLEVTTGPFHKDVDGTVNCHQINNDDILAIAKS